MKIITVFLLCCLAFICRAAVPLDDFFPYGSSNGDTELARNDDDSTPAIEINPPDFRFPFADHQENLLYLNNNGEITFSKGIRTFDPVCGPLGPDLRMVAVFWGDVDTRNGGRVYYRQSTERPLLQKAADDIVKRFPNMIGLNLKWLFIATWMDVAPFEKSIADKQNSFQLVLATDGALSFSLMYYNKLEWANGNGGYAKVGFDVGDGVNFVKVDGSCSSDIINIVDWSNMGIPGKFVFRVDNHDISTSYCDRIAYEDYRQKLKVEPSFVDTMGHVPIAFQGPCFPTDADISCTFVDLVKGPVTVPGELVTSFFGAPTVYCVPPYLYGLGRTDVNVTVTTNETVETYQAYLTVVDLPSEVSVEIQHFEDAPDVSQVNISWAPQTAILKDASHVDIRTIWYDPDVDEMRDLLVVAHILPNNGHAVINVSKWFPDDVNATKFMSSFISFAISPSTQSTERVKRDLAKSFAGRALLKVGKYAKFGGKIGAFAAVTYFAAGIPVLSHFRTTKVSTDNLPPCPCTLRQIERDNNFFHDGLGKISLAIFHPGGVASYRHASGQQCVYDAGGNILVGPPSGGTADYVSPGDWKNAIKHFYYDVVPYFYLCLTSSRCDEYYARRPSDNCANYKPPGQAQGHGDPHMTTLDKFDYTFNGAGEFVVLQVDNSTCVLQARMEQWGTSLASYFTAFAMRQGKTKVHLQPSLLGNTIDVLVDNYHLEFSHPALMTQHFERGQVTVTALNSKVSEVSVSLSCGLAFKFSTASGIMAVTVLASQDLKGKLSGLLGDFDGNKENDLREPNGTLTLPTASLSDIHWQFGIKWMISQDESLFYYSTGKSYDYYARPTFGPKFDMPNLESVPIEARSVCQDSIQCLFDYVATGGDLQFANQTYTVQSDFNETVEISQHVVLKCDDIHAPENGRVKFSQNGVLLGSNATFECNDRYQLVNGQATVVCVENIDGSVEWNGPTSPLCVSLTCLPIEPPLNGETSFSTDDDVYPIGTTVHFSCNPGYTLKKGTCLLTCTGSEPTPKWTGGKVPLCVKSSEKIDSATSPSSEKIDSATSPSSSSSSSSPLEIQPTTYGGETSEKSSSPSSSPEIQTATQGAIKIENGSTRLSSVIPLILAALLLPNIVNAD